MTVTTRGASRQTAPQDVVRARPVRHKRLSGAIVFSICAAMLAAVGMLYLMQTSHVASLGYELSSLQAEHGRASVANQRLEAEVAELQGLDRAERTARNVLDMEPMVSYAYLDVERPAQSDLPLPETPAGDRRGAVQRVWDRLFGVGVAADGETDPRP